MVGTLHIVVGAIRNNDLAHMLDMHMLIYFQVEEQTALF